MLASSVAVPVAPSAEWKDEALVLPDSGSYVFQEVDIAAQWLTGL